MNSNVIYAQIDIDPVALTKQDDNGVIKLQGYFDYDFGIQFNSTDKHYAFGNEISLKNSSDGYGMLTITYGNKASTIGMNPAMSITTQLKKTAALNFKPDNKIFIEGAPGNGNCRINIY